MFRLVLVAVLVAIAAGAAPKVRPIVPMLDGRIVGGEVADITDLPHQISLLRRGSHICGGSILSANRVLTAAHCTDGAIASSLSIRASSTFRGSGGQVIPVNKIDQHPKYNALTIDYDVSVLTLSEDIKLGPGSQPINLHPIGATLNEGDLATVSGWGTLNSGGISPLLLQRVEVPKVTDEYCNSRYGRITDRMTCHGYTAGGKDSCQGDSGGPLVVVDENVQIGVVSWGRGCASANYPGVYAKVANSEIQEHIIQSL